jgi:hypothetical protein
MTVDRDARQRTAAEQRRRLLRLESARADAHTLNVESNERTGEALIYVRWEPDGTAAPHRRGTTG